VEHGEPAAARLRKALADHRRGVFAPVDRGVCRPRGAAGVPQCRGALRLVVAPLGPGPHRLARRPLQPLGRTGRALPRPGLRHAYHPRDLAPRRASHGTLEQRPVCPAGWIRYQRAGTCRVAPPVLPHGILQAYLNLNILQ
jgi:hypothetical protein